VGIRFVSGRRFSVCRKFFEIVCPFSGRATSKRSLVCFFQLRKKFWNVIHAALEAARTVLNRFTPGAIEPNTKSDTIPSPRPTAPSMMFCARHCSARVKVGSRKRPSTTSRASTKQRVWVVDPLDGTREFVQGIPEFCVSIAMVENGIPIAGGICNPATDELILGSRDTGVTYNGKPAQPSQRKDLHGALVLASRSEVKRGEWKQFESAEFNIQTHGIGRLQTRTGCRRSRRSDLHAGSEK
jgi:3'-phosphoadenosine 5'-phosphosulfate (PAPS) 3'-phosphatase